ncbi:MAG: glycosyl hydrolase, partial [Chloroflexota bacterium]|nr:glycosyl hydrolase [Chloroflexota bacterium]
MDTATLLQQLEFRSIGPTRGGRVVAVAGHPTNAATFYFGSTGGGVWRTTDAGQYWENVSDGYFKRASVGGIAVAESDPNVIYVGMGESTIRGNVSHGDGVYRSTDAGKTWAHLGLEKTRNIGKVRVDPRDPERVYVAAFGHAHGPNAERGLYRSLDGGKNWDNVLFISERAGVNDLSIDPHNPRIIFAGSWEAERGPHFMSSGGEGSGLWRSRDGGDSWERLDDKPGMPKGLKGKIGVAVSPARSGRIYAIIEHGEGGVYRSDDGGDSWQRLSEDRNLRQRAWYYSHIYADPQDADTCWVLNVEMWKSIDAGKSFTQVPAPHGDNHNLWIDPQDPTRMILGNDGGGTVSHDGGIGWSTLYNQPTAEFYHATVDTRVPYRVYGAQQDNTTMSVPSQSNFDAITFTEWYEIGGGESGYIAVRPDNPDIVYAGSYQGYLSRYDYKAGQLRNVTVWPEEYTGWGAKDMKYRFNWTSPTILSPHDPSILLTGANVIFKSTDEGMSWDTISPDLTRGDPETLQPSGGPITKDNTGAEAYGTVFTIAESPVTQGVLWSGSDDGLIHVSRDGGANWDATTPDTLPDWALISLIEASPHDPGTAYVAATRYKLDDFAPYLFKTSDYGKTWTKITNGIPGDDFTRVIREDTQTKGLLYAGTETGIYVSFDDGGNWHKLGGNFPVVPIHDLIVHNDDLVIGTHGRSFWIFDDLTTIRQMAGEVAAKAAHLFKPRDTLRYGKLRGFGHTPVEGRNYHFAAGFIPAFKYEVDEAGNPKWTYIDAGNNPPEGVLVRYYLADKPKGEISLTVLDSKGNTLREFIPKKEKASATEGAEQHAESPDVPANLTGSSPDEEEQPGPYLPAKAGMNFFNWTLRSADAVKIKTKGGDQPPVTGPVVPPGAYGLRLTVDGESQTQEFTILPDPRVEASQADYQAQYDLLVKIGDKHTELNEAVNQIRAMREQVDGWVKRTKDSDAGDQISKAGKALDARLDAVEDEFLQVKAEGMQDTINFPVKLNTKLISLAGAVAGGDHAPAKQMHALYDELATRIDEQLAALKQIVAKDVAGFNKTITEANLPAVVG